MSVTDTHSYTDNQIAPLKATLDQDNQQIAQNTAGITQNHNDIAENHHDIAKTEDDVAHNQDAIQRTIPKCVLRKRRCRVIPGKLIS